VKEGETMPGSFEPVHREPLLPWTEVVGKIFDASSCKVDYIVISHLDVLQTLSIVLGMSRANN